MVLSPERGEHIFAEMAKLRRRPYALCLVVFLLAIKQLTCVPSGDVCLAAEDGQRMRHPERCDLYIECNRGQSIVHHCGPELHFDRKKGVCDHEDDTACQAVIYKPHIANKGVLMGSGSKGQGQGPMVYEETVYGFSSSEEHPRKDISEKEMLAYWSVVMETARQSTIDQLSEERKWSHKLKDVVDSPAFRGVSNFLKTRPYAKTLSRSAIAMQRAIHLTRNRFGLSGPQLLGILHKLETPRLTPLLKPLIGQFRPDTALPSVPDIDYCPYPETIDCPADYRSKRSIDGSCNNLVRSIIGRSMTPFRRLVPAKYHDGLGEPRRSVTGVALPGARDVSLTMFPDSDRPGQRTTMAFVFFGQFTDHDLTRTALTMVTEETDHNGGVERVSQVKCGVDGCLTGPGLEACLPIPVPVDDPDFSHFNRCLKFVRDMEVPALDCNIGPREQLNQVTHWLDGSQVYGSTKEEEDLLRDLSDPSRGRLGVLPHPHGRAYKAMLPKEVVSDSMPSDCKNLNETIVCLQAGDPRVNENAGLAMFHVVMVRQHNSIEETLHQLNQDWTGPHLYAESRRIVVAILQHITFNEWLPVLLGQDFIRKFELDLVAEGYYIGYNTSIDGRIPNAFAAAAFRLGHTLLQGKLHRTGEHRPTDDRLHLSETFNKPVHIYDTSSGGLDALIRGLTLEPSQTFDTFFTKQITRSLFTDKPPHGPGHDLLSLNIQRGRDHGLGTYNDYRKFCNLKRAKSFDDLADEVIRSEVRLRLSKLYREVEDIDLFPGGISERSVDGGIAGPTFACIIANAFRNLRKGDRLWYENAEAGFTPAQLREIRKIRLSRILCQNEDSVRRIQPFVFLRPGITPPFAQAAMGGLQNIPVPCESLPDIDLSHWKTNSRK